MNELYLMMIFCNPPNKLNKTATLDDTDDSTIDIPVSTMVNKSVYSTFG